MNPIDERAAQVLSTNDQLTGTLASLPLSGVENGARAFATNGRKDGEGAGVGTGIPVWYDETSALWRTYTTGGAAAA